MSNGKDNIAGGTLDRDQQIMARLAKIEHKVDSIDQTQAFALRKDADAHLAVVKKIFGERQRQAQVYLAVNGSRNVQQIADHLGMKRQNVGPDLKELEDEGLLELKETVGAQNIWGKKPIDRTVRITQFLCKKFSLTEDGLPRPEPKTSRSKPRK